jgi:hypothetical protein
MKCRELEKIVLQALEMLYARDSFLLENDAAEWTIAHRLAVYLGEALPGWNVDCEYNRQGLDRKVKRRAIATGVRPDIIVHHRGFVQKSHNLLAIELKKDATEADSGKACEYTAVPEAERTSQYQYGLALAVRELQLTWFENGSVLR